MQTDFLSSRLFSRQQREREREREYYSVKGRRASQEVAQAPRQSTVFASSRARAPCSEPVPRGQKWGGEVTWFGYHLGPSQARTGTHLRVLPAPQACLPHTLSTMMPLII